MCIFKIILILTIFIVHNTSANYFKQFNISKISLSNEKCEAALNLMISHIGELWALKMLDASTRLIPVGLLNGNPYDIGDFDECLSVDVNIENLPIRGKHCLGILPIPLTQQYIGIDPNILPKVNATNLIKHVPAPRYINSLSAPGIHLAFCVPSVCQPEDLQTIFHNALEFSDLMCRSKDDDQPLTGGAITTITILAIIAFIAVVQTSYDIYLYYNELKPRHEVFIAFSVLTNGRKLLKTTRNPDQITCMNGIRALSMVWVVIGHEYGNYPFMFLQNYLTMVRWINKRENMFILGASVAVDTFFALAGIVTVYAFLKSQDKGVKFNLVMYYVHRYLRLTPALAIVVLVDATLLGYLVNGPLYNVLVNEQAVQGCKKYWWQALLYIQNYTKNVSCLDVTWYLSVDTQLFILSPIVLFPLRKWPKLTLFGILGLIVAGVVTPFAVAYNEDVSNSVTSPDANNTSWSYTHLRFGPYVIGMLGGYIIYELRKGTFKINVPKIYAVPFWILLTAGLVECVYGGYDTMQSGTRLENAIYTGLNRSAWGLGVSLVVITCVAGYGGPINTFLSASIFQFIAKISYSIYLIHMLAIHLRLGGIKNLKTFSNFNIMFDFWGDFMISAGLAILLCLLFESPIIILEKTLFGGFTKPKVQKATVEPVV